MLRRVIRSRRLSALLVAALLLSQLSCQRQRDELTLTGATMGTRYHITVPVAAADLPRGELAAGVRAILDSINASMSTYRDDSEISRFNRAPVGIDFRLSEDFLRVFQLARAVASASGGAYDVTVAPLVNLWGFGSQQLPPAEKEPATERVPTAAAIARAREQVGEHWIVWDAAAGTLRKKRALQVDFSSIAKGYAVDQLAQWLTAQGLHNYLVEIGGELRAVGVNAGGTPWRIGIEQPAYPGLDPAPDPGRPIASFELRDAAAATSGDYRNYFTLNRIRYSHTLDPRTGWPVRHGLVSVTVVHASSAAADAWATALTVLGLPGARRLAAERGLAVYFVSLDGTVLRSEQTPAMARLMQSPS